MIKLNIHSIVDIITNSSTVIYTYQHSTEQAKELVGELLKLCGETDKTPDDVFYYGEFHEDDTYLEDNSDLPDDIPKAEDWKKQSELQREWLREIKLKIMKGETNKPDWMADKTNYNDFTQDIYLELVPKEEKYKALGMKIGALLSSVDNEACYDG